jgi:hypothetical protein
MIFGMGFAYFGHNWAFHGIYIFGLSLIFFAGVLLVIALWPWNPEYYITDKVMPIPKADLTWSAPRSSPLPSPLCFPHCSALCLARSSATALKPSSLKTSSACREKTTMEYSVIGHLHIMLALIAIMITLIIGRWLNFKGILHKVAMPLMILGTIVLNLGVWGVVTPLEPIAHMVIYVGATPSMLAALLPAHLGLGQAHQGRHSPHPETDLLGQKLSAMVRDPLKFGPTWQMLFMNFTTSGIGIFMAIRLDEIFRVWPAREERIELTGHWHVLSAIIATIILLYYGDMLGFKGKVRQVVRLEHHHPFRYRPRRGDRLRNETPLHHRSRTTAAGQRPDVCN